MNYDNSQFTEALKTRGFVVNTHTQSNYGITLMSLASTLNMTYIASNPSPFADTDYLRLLISDSIVARKIKQLGYTYVHLLSGYIAPSTIADINRDFTPAGAVDIDLLHTASYANKLESAGGFDTDGDYRSYYKRSFVSLYLDTTLLKVIGEKLHRFFFQDETAPYDVFSPERFLDTIDELESIVAMPEATFAFVHLLKPHFPIVFDENGNILDSIGKPNHREYFAEFGFVNAKFIQLIDTILEGSQHQPVIIFQADHGSFYGTPRTKDRRFIHFDPYSAYYVPDQYSLEIPQPHTLVNTFPLILNTVFDAGLEFGENRLIELLVGNRSPFEQEDVTESFAHR